MDLLNGLRSYGGLNLRGWVFLQFSAPLVGNYALDPNPSITTPYLVGLGLNPPPVLPKLFCLSVCVTLLNNRVCVHNFSVKPLEYRNDFDTVV